MLFVLFAQHPAKWHPALCPGPLRAGMAQVHNGRAPRRPRAVPELRALSAASHTNAGSTNASWLCPGRTGRLRREASKQNPTKRSLAPRGSACTVSLGAERARVTAKQRFPRGELRRRLQTAQLSLGGRTPGSALPPAAAAPSPGYAPHLLTAAQPRGPHSRAPPGRGLRPAARAGPPRAERRRPRSRQPGQRPQDAPLPAGAALGHGRTPLLPPRRLASRLPSPRPPPAALAAPRPRRRPARSARAPALADREPAAVRGPPGAAACGRPLVGGGGTREGGGGGGGGGGRSFPDSWRLRRWLLLRGSPLEARDPRAPPY